jgi:hypothetical protein
VNPKLGFQAEIKDDDSDRVRIEFENNDDDWRIEVRISDGELREQITD